MRLIFEKKCLRIYKEVIIKFDDLIDMQPNVRV